MTSKLILTVKITRREQKKKRRKIKKKRKKLQTLKNKNQNEYWEVEMMEQNSTLKKKN